MTRILGLGAVSKYRGTPWLGVRKWRKQGNCKSSGDWRCKIGQAATVKTVQWVFKKLNWVTMWSNNSNSGDILKRSESRDSNRYWNTHGHSCITHYSEWLKPPKNAHLRRIAEGKHGLAHNGILLGFEKEILTRATPWRNSEDTAKWDKLDKKRTPFEWFHFCEILRIVKLIDIN